MAMHVIPLCVATSSNQVSNLSLPGTKWTGDNFYVATGRSIIIQLVARCLARTLKLCYIRANTASTMHTLQQVSGLENISFGGFISVNSSDPSLKIVNAQFTKEP